MTITSKIQGYTAQKQNNLYTCFIRNRQVIITDIDVIYEVRWHHNKLFVYFEDGMHFPLRISREDGLFLEQLVKENRFYKDNFHHQN